MTAAGLRAANDVELSDDLAAAEYAGTVATVAANAAYDLALNAASQTHAEELAFAEATRIEDDAWSEAAYRLEGVYQAEVYKFWDDAAAAQFNYATGPAIYAEGVARANAYHALRLSHFQDWESYNSAVGAAGAAKFAAVIPDWVDYVETSSGYYVAYVTAVANTQLA